MLSPLKGGSGLKAKSTQSRWQSGPQSLGALCYKTTTHQKNPASAGLLLGDTKI
ncbi:hypothetical protein SAMN05421813_1012 [Daejeonella rubra]|uniref:Uncharacterized protein n=1 Tax=Daejeonella rubra TaxID=990371 RepID=A0A1G9LMH3_9SPHI|nr:hypothetical protein SAMN05421813_1012 [Daejeonella rubra]